MPHSKLRLSPYCKKCPSVEQRSEKGTWNTYKIALVLRYTRLLSTPEIGLIRLESHQMRPAVAIVRPLLRIMADRNQPATIKLAGGLLGL